MPMVDGKEYPYTKAGKKAAKKAQDRKMYYEGGIVQYKDIKDKVTIEKNLTINGLIKVSKYFNL